MDWDKTPTWECLGLALIRGSKQCGIDILPMFWLRLGSSLLICSASFASQVTWEGSLSIMVKLLMEGNGWWWSIQCFRIVDVLDLECSLTLSLRAWDVSPTFLPKFAVSSPKVPLTEYIAVTKHICNEHGENTEGKDCTEVYQKTKEILQCYKDKKDHTHNISKEEKEAIKTLREDSSYMVLTADKGVALAVMDKSQYIDKCMALLDDTKVYKPCKDTTKNLHRDVQVALQKFNREYGTNRLSWWSKMYYNKLVLTGNSSPAPRFYGIPKIHKANCPICPIVSACGMATYQLAKFLTKILQNYTGITPTFVKDSVSVSISGLSI